MAAGDVGKDEHASGDRGKAADLEPHRQGRLRCLRRLRVGASAYVVEVQRDGLDRAHVWAVAELLVLQPEEHPHAAPKNLDRRDERPERDEPRVRVEACTGRDERVQEHEPTEEVGG
eukprot:CAMPEP_0119409680 /NCGR_PEP_ID=MMETSP1335-20130426/2917_1 /TAXON_ID=259385 /ORGANISM="Chrysoculter rhomboideus, Strain RCC1486" /LENGTH=116 /DNA_ID=CAMNT_0007434087 /DNA_START=26 /DNA_END=373 /DNA_ORIENTATION=-